MHTKQNSILFKLLIIGTLLLMILTLTSCAELMTAFTKLKGELLGNDYIITQYDNYGNQVLTASGNKIAMDCELDEAGEPTSYISITIDGYEWQHVGGTMVLAQNGVDMITDFQLPENMDGASGTSSGLIGIDRFINNYRNSFGKDVVVVVSSQNGVPIGLFQGNDCYMEIPNDLPKTTLLSIDGKLVYIHRANVDIIPTGLFH